MVSAAGEHEETGHWAGFSLNVESESSQGRGKQMFRLTQLLMGMLVLAFLLFLGSTILSTVLSTSFSASMWGDILGQDSYCTYTVIS